MMDQTAEIREAVLAEKIGELSNTVEVYRQLLTILVYEIGKGRNVTISKGNQKQAAAKIGRIDFRQLARGEVRFTVSPPEGSKE